MFLEKKGGEERDRVIEKERERERRIRLLTRDCYAVSVQQRGTD